MDSPIPALGLVLHVAALDYVPVVVLPLVHSAEGLW